MLQAQQLPTSEHYAPRTPLFRLVLTRRCAIDAMRTRLYWDLLQNTTPNNRVYRRTANKHLCRKSAQSRSRQRLDSSLHRGQVDLTVRRAS